jgi:hypothetical protein
MGGRHRRGAGCLGWRMPLHLEFFEPARRYLGWVDQWTTLGTPSTWRYEDGSSLEYVRRVGPQDLMQRQRAFGEPLRRLTAEQQEALAGAA